MNPALEVSQGSLSTCDGERTPTRTLVPLRLRVRPGRILLRHTEDGFH